MCLAEHQPHQVHRQWRDDGLGEFSPLPHRLIHVHQNVPGVLRDVNRIIAEAGANIQAQMLSTTPDIGYLVMDFAGPSAQATRRC